MSRPALNSSQIFLALGTLAATVLGALTALQFDRLAAVGKRLLLAEGREALLQAVLTAGVAGFLCWAAYALVVRAVRTVALRPYEALADRLERLVDGEIDTLVELHAPDAGVRRLARAAYALRQGTLASRRSEAALQARYDAIAQQQADERRLLLGVLTRGAAPAPAERSQAPAEGATPSPWDIPAYVGTGAITEAVALDLTGQFGPLGGAQRDEPPPSETDLSERPLRIH